MLEMIQRWSQAGNIFAGRRQGPSRSIVTSPILICRIVPYPRSRNELTGSGQLSETALSGAKITGQIHMRGASFDGTLDADSLQVGEMLLMRSEGENKASFKDVNLRGAKITGQIDMRGASFGGTLYADSLGKLSSDRLTACGQAFARGRPRVSGFKDSPTPRVFSTAAFRR